MTNTTEAVPAPKTYRPFLDCVLAAAGNPELPDGYDTWGWKITSPDLRTHKPYNSDTRFRWPFPGGTVTDPKTVVDGEPCPTTTTGGFCIALTLQGAASGGYGHATILLLAYRLADVAGEDAREGKRRVSHCMVVDVVSGRGAYRLAAGADLTGADLTRADLTDAYLTGADLTDAYLTRADLTDAYLTRADLTRADLTRAYLTGADLTDADLTDAYLTRADLTRADLTDADLTGADLTDADLTGADLTRADLTRANLTRADLTDADLTRANLTRADLTDADLTRADLTDVKVRKSQLTTVQLAQFTGVPAWVVEDD
jgi:Pentapeptide repeats (8 copies)